MIFHQFSFLFKTLISLQLLLFSISYFQFNHIHDKVVQYSTLSFIPGVYAADFTHSYKDKEIISLWMGSVGPIMNRQETYDYLSLGFCIPAEKIHYKPSSLGEAIMGTKYMDLGIDMKFKENKETSSFCSKWLTEQEINRFRDAVQQQYIFRMLIDDLPVAGFIGTTLNSTSTAEFQEVALYSHYIFKISYNGPQIVEATINLDHPVNLAINLKQINFTYSVQFVPSNKPFSYRVEKYLEPEYFEHQSHTMSVVNSFMMVFILIGFVSLILLKALRKDFARYENDEFALGSVGGEMERDFILDEYGWKLVHGEVFRAPNYLTFLSALYGIGTQLLVLSTLIVFVAYMNWFKYSSGSMLTTSIFIYALASFISGFMAGRYYTQYGGQKWIKTILLSSCLFPTTVGMTMLIINFFSIAKVSTKAIPFGTIVALFSIWFFIVFPLTLLGATLAKFRNYKGNFPCRVNPIPRPVPDKPWYAESYALVAMSGLVPFMAIYMEIYLIFSSIAQDKVYFVYGFLILVFVILILLTACISIVSTYTLLNAEDHRWHWISFFVGGSSSIYVFLYSIYFFIFKSHMYGYFQTIWFFGHVAMVCFGMFIMLGTVGHVASELFIRKVYQNVKVD